MSSIRQPERPGSGQDVPDSDTPPDTRLPGSDQMTAQKQRSSGADDFRIEEHAASSGHPDNAAIAREAAAIYPDTNAGRPTPEEIAIEAYKIYQGRGGADGRDVDDWLEAQRRLSQSDDRVLPGSKLTTQEQP